MAVRRSSTPQVPKPGAPLPRITPISCLPPAIDLTRSVDEIQELKDQARAKGRDVGVLTFSHVICRETEEEATALRDRLMGDLADWDAVDNLVNLQFAHARVSPTICWRKSGT